MPTTVRNDDACSDLIIEVGKGFVPLYGKVVISISKITMLVLLLNVASHAWSSESFMGNNILTNEAKSAVDRLWSNIADDYRSYYGFSKYHESLLALAISGTLANSDLDQETLQELFNDDLNSDSSNQFFNQFNRVGDYSQLRYTIPLYVTSMLIGNALFQSSNNNVVGLWGSKALRTVILGAPQQLFLSNATGGQRPNEGDSNWDLFNGDNGVSGHAFYGAVPLLTAARLSANEYVKTSLIITSMLPGLSRVNNNRHYMSQVLLGWSLAFISSNVVFQVDYDLDIEIAPFITEDGMLVGIRYRY